MRALVTGGAGYLGSHLADALLQAGHEVCVLDLEAVVPQHPQCEVIVGSVTDAGLVARAVQDVEIVFHLAWSFRTWRFYPQSRPDEERREMEENLLGTMNVLSAALAEGVRHFLFAGSAVVYGPTGPVRVSEEHACHPQRTALGGPVYGISKWVCEKMCLVYHRRGLPATIFRLHGVFSKERLGQFGGMIERAQAGEPVPAVHKAGGEYAHLADALRAFLLTMDDPRAKGQVFNLAGSHTYREPELAHWIVAATQSPSEVTLVDDSLRAMVSVSVGKLRHHLGYRPERGEFLTALLGEAIDRMPA
jgi:UDP-glucose 4-epimerase